MRVAPEQLRESWRAGLLVVGVGLFIILFSAGVIEGKGEYVHRTASRSYEFKEAELEVRDYDGGRGVMGFFAEIDAALGDKLLQRLGWQPRCKPTQTRAGRLVLPLYSDTYSFSLMALSDDVGKTWRASEPLIGFGNIQPAVLERRDGTLVAYGTYRAGDENTTLHVREVATGRDTGLVIPDKVEAPHWLPDGSGFVYRNLKDPDDPFAMVHLEGDALASDPSRLVEEAHTIPLFGGKRAVWVKPTSRNISSAVEALIAAPPVDCRVVIEAGDLRRTSPIRTMCEKSKAAAAIACYVDNERDLARLVDEEMREAKLAIAPDAKAALVALIGGDRRASRSEIRKLALYAHGRGKVDIDDVMAVVADASGLALDDVIDAAFAGKIADAETNFSKAIADGTAPGTIMFAAVRQVMQLQKARLALENGDSTDEALRVFIPPVHFRRKSLVETALRNWSSARLGKLMEQLAEAIGKDKAADQARKQRLRDASVQLIPTHRRGEPDEIGGTAVYLASAASDMVNGHIHRRNG